jgi:hypothetical protein
MNVFGLVERMKLGMDIILRLFFWYLRRQLKLSETGGVQFGTSCLFEVADRMHTFIIMVVEVEVVVVVIVVVEVV